MSKFKIFSKIKPRKDGDIQLKLVREDGEIVVRAFNHLGDRIPQGAILSITKGGIKLFEFLSKGVSIKLEDNGTYAAVVKD